MAKNEVFAYTKSLPLPLPVSTAPSSPVKVGDVVGVALVGNPSTAAGGTDGAISAVALDGTWRLNVTGAVTAIGSKVYIDSSSALQVTASGNTFYGYALAIKDAAAGVIPVYVPGV